MKNAITHNTQESIIMISMGGGVETYMMASLLHSYVT